MWYRNKNMQMKHLKIFESYSNKEYYDALMKVKEMVRKNKPNAEIIAHVSKFVSDTGEILEELRLMLGRIDKEYNKHIAHYKNLSNRYIRCYTLRPVGKKRVSTGARPPYRQSTEENDPGSEQYAIDFVKNIKDQFEKLTKDVNGIDRIKNIFYRIFEALDWINETGVKRTILISNLHQPHSLLNPDPLRDAKISNTLQEIENLKELSFDNEVDEVKGLIRYGKVVINEILNEE